MELWAAFLIGLAGSVHCAGMCGPLAIALPGTGGSRISLVTSRILYNLGRIISYALIGVVFGLLGSGFAVYGFQRYLSVALGVIILLNVLLPHKSILNRMPAFDSYTAKLRQAISLVINKDTVYSWTLLGMLNGLLPCGLVYVAIAGAAASADIFSGMSFMVLFGLGTLPLMLSISIIGKYINTNLRKMNRLVPVLAAVLAIIFIIRGMNLGIPYLSPAITPAVQAENKDCCK
ncbi:MAG: sulfite exporter TauE/SafE family protein [Ignavibacteriales bacterium]